jgi:hypothetical protein
MNTPANHARTSRSVACRRRLPALFRLRPSLSLSAPGPFLALVVVVSLAPVLAPICPATADPGDVIWTFHGIEDINTFGVIKDIDGDLVDDVLVSSYDAGASGDFIYLLSGGSVTTPVTIWSGAPFSGISGGGGYGDGCITVCPDLNGDGEQDLLYCTAWGSRSVLALDGQDGSVIWDFDTYDEPYSGWVYHADLIADRTGDGVPEVVFGAGSDNETGYLLDGSGGSVLWRFYGAVDAIVYTVAMTDVNADGLEDALFCGGDNEHRVFCVSGAGAGSPVLLWSADMGASNFTAVLGDDASGDGIPDPVIGTWQAADQVICLDATDGHILWHSNQGSYSYIMRLVAFDDLNGDGIREIAVGSFDNAVRVIDGSDGHVIWTSFASTLNGGDFWAVDYTGDVTGDGIDEVIGGSFDQKVYLFSGADGDTLWMHNTGYRLYSVRGVGDLSGNGAADVLAGTQFQTSGGLAFALEGGSGPTAVPPALQVSGRATAAGAGPGAATVELAWSCDQPLGFHVDRLVGPDKAMVRQAAVRGHEAGDLTVREVLAIIQSEQGQAPTRLTPEPLQPVGPGSGGWLYRFVDQAAIARAGTVYRLSAVLPGGGEQAVLELTARPGTLPGPILGSVRAGPNPFNSAVQLTCELKGPAVIEVAVCDLRGRRVATLPPQAAEAGRTAITWNARTTTGRELATGTYLFVVHAGGDVQVARATLVK